jgi:hypothetical protein
VAALMRAAGRMRRRLPAATYQALIGLLAVTGCFSQGHWPWRKSGLHVCAAQRLIE